MNDVRFVTTGYVTPQRTGPLSLTVLTPTELRIVEVLGNTRSIARNVREGASVAEVTCRISSLRKSETSIPLERIRSLRWVKRENGLRIDYDDEQGHSRKKTTYIQTDANRLQLVDHIERAIGHQFQRREEPAGFWKLAWSQMLGALLCVAGTVWIELMWDPKLLAQVRHGWIALKLGRVGCALVGLALLAGCLISAWRRVHPRPVEHHCIV